MTRAGEALPLQLNNPFQGYGENTLVWEPQADFGIPPGGDTSYHVTVSDVLIGGQPHTFAYTVVIFDPE